MLERLGHQWTGGTVLRVQRVVVRRHHLGVLGRERNGVVGGLPVHRFDGTGLHVEDDGASLGGAAFVVDPLDDPGHFQLEARVDGQDHVAGGRPSGQEVAERFGRAGVGLQVGVVLGLDPGPGPEDGVVPHDLREQCGC